LRITQHWNKPPVPEIKAHPCFPLALGDRQKLQPPQNPKEKKLRTIVLAEPSDWLHEISISKTMSPFSTWANTLPKTEEFLTLGVFVWKSLSCMEFICPTSLQKFQGDG
jgi:hypothetical protein